MNMKIIRFVFKPKSALVLPFAHFQVLQGLVYKMLSENPSLSEEVHNKKYDGTKPFKFFCFTDINGRYRINGRSLLYSDCFSWEIRSADLRIIDAIRSYVLHNRCLEIEHTQCEVVSLEVVEKHFFDNKLSVVMNTPAVVCETDETGFTVYHSPFEAGFTEKITSNIVNKYSAFYDESPENGIRISSVAPKEKNKCVTRYKNTIITAWYGEFVIEADSEVIEFVYHTGIGSKNSMGFGTVAEKLTGIK